MAEVLLSLLGPVGFVLGVFAERWRHRCAPKRLYGVRVQQDQLVPDARRRERREMDREAARKMAPRLVVIAGTTQQALDHLRHAGRDPRDPNVVIVGSPQKLRGLRLRSDVDRVVRVGTWANRFDLEDVEATLAVAFR